MSIEIKLKINGVEEQLSVNPMDTLVNVLRDRLGLVGTNKDCEMGICGACTVLLEGRPISSCLLLAVQADGSAITTVEGMESGGKLNRVQEAFLRHGAVQCGYCTPGFITTATALLEENPKPSRAEITDAIRGNLCRCTGYTKIIDAIESVANS